MQVSPRRVTFSSSSLLTVTSNWGFIENWGLEKRMGKHSELWTLPWLDTTRWKGKVALVIKTSKLTSYPELPFIFCFPLAFSSIWMPIFCLFLLHLAWVSDSYFCFEEELKESLLKLVPEIKAEERNWISRKSPGMSQLVANTCCI